MIGDTYPIHWTYDFLRKMGSLKPHVYKVICMKCQTIHQYFRENFQSHALWQQKMEKDIAPVKVALLVRSTSCVGDLHSGP